MNVNIGGTMIIHDAIVSALNDGTKLSITYDQSDDNLSLDGARSIFEEPQPCISIVENEEDGDETYYYGYIESEVTLNGNDIVITMVKPNIEKRLDYLFELVLSLKTDCVNPVIAANSMMNEHAELVSNMVYNMLRN